VNRTATLKHLFFIPRRKICLLTLLAILFQAFFVTTASARIPAELSVKHTFCHHFEKAHSSHGQMQCLWHCEVLTGHYTQNLLLDDLSLFAADKISNISTYFNLQASPVLTSDVLLTIQFENLQASSKASPVFLNTARLRI